MSGLIYLAAALVLDALFLYHALVLKISARRNCRCGCSASRSTT